MILSSCDKLSVSKSFPAVDFSESLNIQLTYKQNIYNTKILYSSGSVFITFSDRDSSLDGITYKVNSEICEISYKGITHDVSIENLPDSFLPLVIYKFVSDSGGIVYTENYDSDRLCSYVLRNVFGSSVVLEVYESENNIAYSLMIT